MARGLYRVCEKYNLTTKIIGGDELCTKKYRVVPPDIASDTVYEVVLAFKQKFGVIPSRFL